MLISDEIGTRTCRTVLNRMYPYDGGIRQQLPIVYLLGGDITKNQMRIDHFRYTYDVF